MDFDPKHDQALDLPLRFPDDPVDEPPPSSTSMRRQKSQDPQKSSSNSNNNQKQAASPAQPSAPRPNFTLYIRVPAPRNGFVDPPDVDWNKEKDDALWRILSRASKNDIDSQTFNATVDFLLIQATILTERHVSQVRAQTRKVATLTSAGAAGGGGRDSPMPSPATAGPGATPTSEAMGRTLSSGGHPAGSGGRTATAETMRRTASAGSRTGPPPVGGGSGSRRPSIEEAQGRPARPTRPSLETITSFSHTSPGVGAPGTPSPVSRGHPTYSPATAQHYQTRLQSPLPIRPARPTDTGGGGRRGGAYETEGDDEDDYEDGGEPESPAATSDSGSSSSTPSEPVMSRIFKRPPGHTHGQQNQGVQRQPRGGDGDFGVVGLGISSGGSDDDDDESETQAAFLRFKSPSAAARTSAGASGSSGIGSRHRQHAQNARQQRRSNTVDSSSPSSSASASPTTKVFKAPTVAAAAAAAAGGSTSASAMAAARLQSSRVPGIRSPPRLQKTLSGRSPAVLVAKAAGVSREGSETGTTPSIGSSFSDLDDVSFTQSVLDEALGSKVEDTVVTPNLNNVDPMSSSATRRQR
ncbi:hypothetical protein SEUCBS140593_002702 [Sporothrix eucalyptigena]|uniref:Autophagy-related protein 29 n=1 Tax=Sporothrix eucalyptigena TaxID=1812306 RepID=A0ABP0B8Q9_9PEZI